MLAMTSGLGSDLRRVPAPRLPSGEACVTKPSMNTQVKQTVCSEHQTVCAFAHGPLFVARVPRARLPRHPTAATAVVTRESRPYRRRYRRGLSQPTRVTRTVLLTRSLMPSDFLIVLQMLISLRNDENLQDGRIECKSTPKFCSF